MRKVGFYGGFIAVFIIHAVLIGCATDISDNEISIRKQSLFEETNILPDKGEYADSSPGESKTIARAFENSPPLIPHDITDMLPITTDENMCVQCHMPDAAGPRNAKGPASSMLTGPMILLVCSP